MNKKRVILFFVVFVFFNLSANYVHPVTPTFIVERQLDSSMFGVALASMMTMNFLFSPFWGKLCNYIPTRRILMIGSLGYAVGQTFFLLARTELMVIAGRMFAGAFLGGLYTGFSNYIINISPEGRQRASNLTIYVTVHSISSAFGYFIGGFLGLISVEAAFITQIVCLSLSGLLFMLVCLDDTPYKVRPATPFSVREANPFRAFGTVHQSMTPLLAPIFTIVAIAAIGVNSFEQCFNYYIKDQFGMTSAYNGIFKGLIALGTLVLNATVCSTLQRKTDINKTFLYILAGCAALISTILIFRGKVLFVVVYILFSSFNVLQQPLLQSIIAVRSVPETRNNLMGFHQSMTSLGGIFGALFAGVIYKQGPLLPFVLAFFAYIAASVVGLIYVRRYQAEQKAAGGKAV